MASSPTRTLVFLDIDIDDWRAGYQRAVEFVEQNNLKYGLSSDQLHELGGGEKKKVKQECYPNDYEWSTRGPIRMKQRAERIVIEVWPEKAPLSCENFLALITGKKGVSGAVHGSFCAGWRAAAAPVMLVVRTVSWCRKQWQETALSRVPLPPDCPWLRCSSWRYFIRQRDWRRKYPTTAAAAYPLVVSCFSQYSPHLLLLQCFP